MSNDMFQLCKKYLHRYVLVYTEDSHEYDGIIENVDKENLYLAVPISDVYRDGIIEHDDRQFYGGEWYSGYPYYGTPYFGYPYYPRPKRFNRLVLPLAVLTTLTILPYY